MLTSTEHRSTSRVLDILELVSSEGTDGFTLSEIASRLNAPKSSLFPIIHTLHARRFLELNPATGRYCIGLAAFTVGVVFSNKHTLLEHIHNEMRQVTEGCGEICQMGVADRGKVLYVAKVESPNAIRLISSVGKRLPLYSTSLGKALLMCWSDDQIRALYPDSSHMPAITANTVTDPDTLIEQLHQMRKAGYASECGESDENIRCVAVPLVANGQVMAALSVSAPLFRFDEERQALALEKLFCAKQNIESLLRRPDFAPEVSGFIELV
ncbi:IclR family transcriptional regulator [Allofournierella sp. CML151]|uniref:IclR family transcriptional regulator n=1 Tax=Allofournierella sp. CML151 TaxID=2998082 RepID=UPI0013020F33|nr:IclR family transcriptional regulator [Fournierella sp. CML151]